MSSNHEGRKRKNRFEDTSSHASDNMTDRSKKTKTIDSNDLAQRTAKIKETIQQQMRMMMEAKNLDTVAEIGRKTSAFKPAPLLLDEQGRQIDASGKVIQEKIAPMATLKANKSSQKVETTNPYLAHHSVDRSDRLDAVDPRLHLTKRETRGEKSFNFVQEGTFVKQAEQYRNREAKREIAGKMMAGYASGRNPNTRNQKGIVSISENDEEMGIEKFNTVPLKRRDPVPDVEWWDIDYLDKERKEQVDNFGFIKPKCRKENPDISISYSEMKLKNCGTAHLIEHSARVKPLVKEKKTAVPMKLMLTEKERKRIRRQNRADREKEKQDKIALGLLPPPEPKVKLSNMMRVLQEQAVADPSAVEKKVREQVAQRIKNHEMRNLARKLTPEERREKTKRKIKEDAAGDTHVAVFRVLDLSDPKIRFKVDVNAQQWHLTGGVLICAEERINMVVVEGGRKAINGYIKLMTRRIDWNSTVVEEKTNSEPNECVLVWQGVVARPIFNSFRFQDCRTAITARKVMEAKNAAHYWDMVYGYDD